MEFGIDTGRARVIDLSSTPLRGQRPEEYEKWKDLIDSAEMLSKIVELFNTMDGLGIPEEWSPHVLVGLDKVFAAFIAFQREVNAVVAGDPHFAAIRERQGQERIELLEDGTARSVLEDSLRLAERAPVEAVAVMRRMIHALDDERVNGSEVE